MYYVPKWLNTTKTLIHNHFYFVIHVPIIYNLRLEGVKVQAKFVIHVPIIYHLRLEGVKVQAKLIDVYYLGFSW